MEKHVGGEPTRAPLTPGLQDKSPVKGPRAQGKPGVVGRATWWLREV